MAHQQVKEEYRAMIRLIRRVMYPLFKVKDKNFDTTRFNRGGGLLIAHDLIVKRYMQIIRNEEREQTTEETDLLSAVTSSDIIREIDEDTDAHYDKGASNIGTEYIKEEIDQIERIINKYEKRRVILIGELIARDKTMWKRKE